MLELLKEDNSQKIINEFYEQYGIQVVELQKNSEQKVFDANGNYLKIWDRDELKTDTVTTFIL